MFVLLAEVEFYCPVLSWNPRSLGESELSTVLLLSNYRACYLSKTEKSPKCCPIKLSGLLLGSLQKVPGLPWWRQCLVRQPLPTSCSPPQPLTLRCSQLARLFLQLEGELQNWSSWKITFPSASPLPYFSASSVSLILFNSHKYWKWQNMGVECRGRKKQRWEAA